MTGAKQHQVFETCFTTMGPMLNVVSGDISLVLASRESTVLVPGPQRTFDGFRNNSGLATDIEWVALLIFNNRNHVTVTTQTLHGLDRQARAAVTSHECGLVNVHGNQVITGTSLSVVARQE